jgi:hypothetical protein
VGTPILQPYLLIVFTNKTARSKQVPNRRSWNTADVIGILWPRKELL